MRTFPWPFAAIIAVALLAPNARARQGGLILGYQSPGECPSREHFWGQLWDRSARLQTMMRSELTITVDARITGTDSGYVGRLLLVDSTGEVLQREVGGSTCAEVSTALALIAAVSLDALPTGWQPTLPASPRHKKALKRLAIGPSLGIHEAVAPHAVPTLGLSATYRARQYVGSPELRLEALISLDRYQPVFDDATSFGHPALAQSHNSNWPGLLVIARLGKQHTPIADERRQAHREPTGTGDRAARRR